MKKYIIRLSTKERTELTADANRQKVAAQKKLRAQALLACDQGDHGPGKTDETIVAELPISRRSMQRLREWACDAGPAHIPSIKQPSAIMGI